MFSKRVSNIVLKSVAPIVQPFKMRDIGIRNLSNFRTDFDVHAYIVYERANKRDWLKRLHGFQKLMHRKMSKPIEEIDGVPVIPFSNETFKNDDELEDLMYRTGFKQFMIDPFEYLNKLEKAFILKRTKTETTKENGEEANGEKENGEKEIGEKENENENDVKGKPTKNILIDDELTNQITEAIKRYLLAQNKKDE